MSKINMSVEIVRSSIVSLSSMMQKSANNIAEVLKLQYQNVRVTNIDTAEDLEALALRNPDLVFVGMKFIPKNPALGFNDPEKIWLADFFESHNIAYTGSNHKAHKLELDKPLAKLRVQRSGLATSPFYVAMQNLPLPLQNLQFPLFVKPTNKGGGLGIDSQSVVHDAEQLRAKIAAIATNHQADALVEQYLDGREFSVAVLKKGTQDAFFTMPLELIAPVNEKGDRVLSEKIKAADTETFVAVTDPVLRAKLTTLGLKVFAALGARDYGRIDIRLDASGTPQFLEANLIPSLLKGYGNFPKACLMNIGLEYEQMILRIAELGLTRRTEETQDIYKLDGVGGLIESAYAPL